MLGLIPPYQRVEVGQVANLRLEWYYNEEDAFMYCIIVPDET
jgi:hypothetical protein